MLSAEAIECFTDWFMARDLICCSEGQNELQSRTSKEILHKANLSSCQSLNSLCESFFRNRCYSYSYHAVAMLLIGCGGSFGAWSPRWRS
jgi:hypothetical protein